MHLNVKYSYMKNDDSNYISFKIQGKICVKNKVQI